MKFILVTYDETSLPVDTTTDRPLDVFDRVNSLLLDLGVEAGMSEFGRPQSVADAITLESLAEGGTPAQRLLLALEDVLPYAENDADYLNEQAGSLAEGVEAMEATRASNAVNTARALIEELRPVVNQ